MPGDKDNMMSGTDEPTASQTDEAAQVKSEAPISRSFGAGSTHLAAQFVMVSLIAASLIVIALVSFGVLVPAHITSGVQNQIDSIESEMNSLRSQNENLRAELERSQTQSREYETKLERASPEQTRSQLYEMQVTIKALEQQMEAMRAAEWPPLTASAQESLYQHLKDMPAQEVWVGYADYGGRELARTFSHVFNRLNWPQKHEILAVHDPQDGLWITPISDFSEQLRDKIAQSTGLQFTLFPRRERFPDRIGVIVGYRAPNQEASQTP